MRPERRKARAGLATAERIAKRQPGDPKAAETALAARRDYYALALEDHIRQVVDAAPPLTPEQRDRLASLLRPIPQRGAA